MRTSIAGVRPHLLLCLLVVQACYQVAAHDAKDPSVVVDSGVSSAKSNELLTSSSSLVDSSSALSLRQEVNVEPKPSNLRRSLKKQVGDCVGSKFQIIIHFDAHPEDFSMSLVNDDINKTVWDVNDPRHNYSSPSYQHKEVAAGVCLPKDWCWILTVYDKTGDGMFMRNMTIPGQGGGMRLLFNGLSANYYTGKWNGCYRKMWFRFGEYCSAALQFGYEPGDTSIKGCGRFNVGKAPDDDWFEGNLYQVGTAPPSAPVASRAPHPAVRTGPADRPLEPKTLTPVHPPPFYQPFAPVKPVPAPVQSVSAPTKPVPAPTKPVPAPTKPVPAPTKPVPAPTQPVPAPTKPVPAPTKPVPAPTQPVVAPTKPVPAPTSWQGAPVRPVLCHFGGSC